LTYNFLKPRFVGFEFEEMKRIETQCFLYVLSQSIWTRL